MEHFRSIRHANKAPQFTLVCLCVREATPCVRLANCARNCRPFTGKKKRRSAPHRFSRRCGFPVHAESCSTHTRTKYPLRASWAISSQRCSTSTAASAFPCAHKVGAHSPQAATRGRSPFDALAGCGDQIARDFQKSNRVRQIIHHESRERVGNIQRDIAPLFNGGDNVHAMCLQCCKKISSV